MKTYLKENYKSKQLAFLRTWCDKNGFEHKFIQQIRYKINGWELKTEEQLDPKMNRLIEFHRKLLGIGDKSIVSEFWIQRNYDKIIIYFSVISRYLQKNGKREILLAPLPKIKASYLYIDSKVFKGILKDINYINIKRKYDESMYNDIFKIDKLLTDQQKQNGFEFTKTIQTDGVAINFHFRRPNLPVSDKQELNRNDPNIRVIAQDPGRVTLFCGIEKLDNGEYKQYKLSRKKFYTDAGIFKAVKKTNKWNTELKTALEQLSQTSSRSNSLKDFLKYVRIVKLHENIFWNEYTKQRYARQRFALYSGKKKVYDKFFNSIKESGDITKKVVIAFGDAGFASTSKYEISAPTTTLEKQCSKWFNIVKVDEFRTTKLHCDSGSMLAKVFERITIVNNNTKSIKAIRGLLWFKDTTNCCKFIDRDLNAAKNILKCYRSFPERPPGMDRNDPKQEDLPKHYINKEIHIEVVSERYAHKHEALMWLNNFQL
jgi:hypothetical protein